MPNINSVMDSYLLAVRANGRAKATVKWYAAMLTGFLEAFSYRDVASIKPDEIRAYIVSLQERVTLYENASQRPVKEGGLSGNSLAGHSTALHAFWGWAAREYDIKNPMSNIKRIRPPEPTPRAISAGDFTKMFQATGDDLAGYRDRAILALFADSGMRLAELAGLKVENLNNGRAVVTGKGNKSRVVVYTQAVGYLLQTWLTARESESAYIFTSIRTGETLTKNGIEQIMQRLKERAGVTGRGNPHAFRHRFALEYMKNAGGGELSLSKLMGHKSPTTTITMYGLFSPDELSELHEKRSPLKSLSEAG